MEYLVWVDDTPVMPEHPLTAEDAAAQFLGFVEGGEPHAEIRIYRAEEWD